VGSLSALTACRLLQHPPVLRDPFPYVQILHGFGVVAFARPGRLLPLGCPHLFEDGPQEPVDLIGRESEFFDQGHCPRGGNEKRKC